MSKQATKRRPKPWTLAQVRTECSSAPTVWLALMDMAEERGSSVLTPTRQILSEATGIKKHATVSMALSALERARWIDRVHIPSWQNGQRTTLLRLVLRHSARKTVRTARAAVAPEKGAKGSARKTGADFYSVKGGGTKKPSPPPCRSGTPPGRQDTPPKKRQPEKEHPAEKIERERMEEIRTQRETKERAEQESRQPPKGSLGSVKTDLRRNVQAGRGVTAT